MTYMFAPIGTYDTDFNYEDYITESDKYLKCLKCDEKLIVDDNNKIICNKCNKEYKIIYNKQHNKNEVMELE